MPDHATPSKLMTHSSEPVPFVLVTSNELRATGAASRSYTEAEASRTGLLVRNGYRLIESLFGRDLGSVAGQ
jgi:2,3-bisphosphoglycerate-independent phosphoglycerate mutase